MGFMATNSVSDLHENRGKVSAMTVQYKTMQSKIHAPNSVAVFKQPEDLATKR
jgi:hypothetical protein